MSQADFQNTTNPSPRIDPAIVAGLSDAELDAALAAVESDFAVLAETSEAVAIEVRRRCGLGAPMAENDKGLSRRSFFRGSPAAAMTVAIGLSSLPAVDLVSQAIERHRETWAKMDAWEAATEEGLPEEIVAAEIAAREALALTPCADDRQFIAKMRHLLAREKSLWRDDWRDYAHDVLNALDFHLTGSSA